jgi:hypothetical protein
MAYRVLINNLDNVQGFLYLDSTQTYCGDLSIWDESKQGVIPDAIAAELGSLILSNGQLVSDPTRKSLNDAGVAARAAAAAAT